MKLAAQKVKAKMLEMTQLFGIERNFFQKFVIIHRYIRYLNTEPLTKGILQKMFDNTARAMGNLNNPELNEDEFLNVKGEVIFDNDFWTYYQNLEVIHGKMKKLQSCQLKDKAEYDGLCRLFSKPYSKEMFDLSFAVVNSNIFDHLDQEIFFESSDTEPKVWFDDEKSILHYRGEKIKISLQKKITNAHKVLRHIFIANKDNLNDDFYYSEMAETEFGDMEYTKNPKSWEKYHMACKVVNGKVKAKTGKPVDKFLVFNTGNMGKVSLNKQFLT